MISTEVSIRPRQYSLDTIRDEVRQLLEKGLVSRNQPLYVLCQLIPAREWVHIECELERCDYLLRDRIGDIVACETWDND
jgi:uncharacterized protein YqgQ